MSKTDPDREPIEAAGAKRDRSIEAARDAELDRQDAVAAAVAKANETELPKLGGPLLEPGLGR